MADLDSNPDVQFGVIVDNVDPIVYLCLITETGTTCIAMDYAQAFSAAQLMVDALAKIDIRSGERSALDALFNLQSESPRNDHTDQS